MKTNEELNQLKDEISDDKLGKVCGGGVVKPPVLKSQSHGIVIDMKDNNIYIVELDKGGVIEATIANKIIRLYKNIKFGTKVHVEYSFRTKGKIVAVLKN